MRSLGWIRGAQPLVGLLLVGGIAACSLTSLAGLTGGLTGADGGSGEPNGSTGPTGTTGGTLSDGGPAPFDSDASSSYQAGPDGSRVLAVDGAGGTTENDAGSSPIGDPPDASSPIDSGTTTTGGGGTDASSAKDTGTTTPPAYCASLSPSPLFCDDFDEGSLATPWDQVSGLNGSASIDTTYYVSSPNAMLAKVNANATAGDVDVAGYKSFTGQQGIAGTYTLTFELRIDAADTSSSSDAVLGAVQLWNGSTAWDVELEVAYASSTGDFSATLTEDGQGAYVQHPASQNLPKGVWTRVAIAITLPAGTNGATPATLSFNGDAVVSATVNVKTSDPIPEIILGPTYASSASSGWQVRYDDVTFN